MSSTLKGKLQALQGFQPAHLPLVLYKYGGVCAGRRENLGRGLSRKLAGISAAIALPTRKRLSMVRDGGRWVDFGGGSTASTVGNLFRCDR
ncbi:MAG TPA: hypothetical protein VE944_26745 [Nostoc sp.]|uniref:hypothetical protein n=1 Tax=Nostoc sp. TaxID=1180 RepID=UPI002D40B051|nr:hypothetical protein [Nostoc sp.]HYX17894.1 hypothetical protein [Nostoc sp.]